MMPEPPRSRADRCRRRAAAPHAIERCYAMLMAPLLFFTPLCYVAAGRRCRHAARRCRRRRFDFARYDFAAAPMSSRRYARTPRRRRRLPMPPFTIFADVLPRRFLRLIRREPMRAHDAPAAMRRALMAADCGSHAANAANMLPRGSRFMPRCCRRAPMLMRRR